MKTNNKGFTLAELLIVVAIIAVLVGISIPVFTGQLEKSKESKDLANVRSAYAELMMAVITEDETDTYSSTGEVMYKGSNTYSVNVPLSQTIIGWESVDLSVAGVSSSDSSHWIGLPGANGKCKVEYKADLDEVFFFWDGSNISSGDGGGILGGTPGSPTPPGGSNTGALGNTAPTGTIKDQIQSSAAELPQALTGDQTQSIVKGNVYSYNGNTYVALDNKEYHQYYYATPETDYWAYRLVDMDKVLTSADLNEHGSLNNLRAGALYKGEDDSLYIIKSDQDWQNPPPGDNWIKINLN